MVETQEDPQKDGFSFTPQQQKLMSLSKDQMAKEIFEMNTGFKQTEFQGFLIGTTAALFLAAAIILIFKQRTDGGRIGGITVRSIVLVVVLVVMVSTTIGILTS